MFVLDWQLALLSLAFLPLLLLVTVRFSRRLQPILRDVQQKIADVTATAEENVTGSRIVRIFAREDDELAKFSDRSTRVFEAEVSAARIRALLHPADRLSAQPGGRRAALRRRPRRSSTAASAWARSSPSTAT